MNFFGNFIKTKASNAKNNLTEMLAKWDPETATEAEINTMYDEFVKLSKKAEQARQSMDKEKTEAKNIENSYNKKLQILDVLQNRKAEAENSGNTEELEEIVVAMNELLDSLEELKPEVEREVEEAKEAEQYFNELSEAVQNLGSKIKTARKTIENAKKRMQRAELTAKKAKEREERAKELAGLKSAANSTGVAFDALTRAAEKMEADAKAADSRSKVLNSLNPKEEKNSLIAKIEAEMSENQVSKPTSLEDRINNLKKF